MDLSLKNGIQARSPSTPDYFDYRLARDIVIALNSFDYKRGCSLPDWRNRCSGGGTGGAMSDVFFYVHIYCPSVNNETTQSFPPI